MGGGGGGGPTQLCISQQNKNEKKPKTENDLGGLFSSFNLIIELDLSMEAGNVRTIR